MLPRALDILTASENQIQGAHVIKDLDLSHERQVLEILDLQRASYAVEAELIGSFARALVEHIEGIAGTADWIVVSTGAKNVPAKRLYRSLGFEETREAEAVPALRITFFEKSL